MAEKDESYEGQEEGEYHFSDEHASYEMESESPKIDAQTKTASAALTGFSKYRRPVIVGIVVMVALVGVYKMLMPGYTPQATDFTQTTTPTTTTKPVQTAQTAPIAQPAPASPAPSQAQQAAQIAAATPPLPDLQAQSPVQGQPGTQPGSLAAPGSTAQPATMTDRVAAIEDQNAKLTSMLQNDYAQKMADQAAQDAALQQKVQDLSARMATMEAAITQLTQLLQNKMNTSSAAPVSAPSREFAQHVSYVVQAIIPGRAWLKSESGDTITVAEGDRVRGYGRVTKIDPYDGVVTIDTGSKLLTLSYGMSSDS